jgi:hypothetical protein
LPRNFEDVVSTASQSLSCVSREFAALVLASAHVHETALSLDRHNETMLTPSLAIARVE